MKLAILFVVAFSFPLSGMAIEKEKRIEAAYAAIGAYVVKNQEKDFAKSEIQLKDYSMARLPALDLLPKYYMGNYDAYFASVSDAKTTKALVEIGKKYVEKIMQKVAGPICKKLKICKLSCYVDVAGDVIDLVLIEQPELYLIKAPFQTYIVDGGMKYLSRICKC